MRILFRFFAYAALASASLSCIGQQTAVRMEQQTEPEDQFKIKPALPEYWANPTGQYDVVVDDQTLPEHTLFYPADLSGFPESDRLPVLVMSGPGCDKTSSAFRPFFTEVASHGYLFIVSGVLTEETVMTGKLPKNTKQDLLDAIDWAFAENCREGSIFFGKVDTENVCAMGQSCGGIQALDIRKDPRITLLALFNSGLFANPMRGMSSMGEVMSRPKSETLAELKVPIAYFVGDTDMARPNAADDFKYINDVPVFLAVREIPGDAHAGTFRENNGGAFAEACVAWLDWWCKDDLEAGMMFRGAPSGLEASSSKWVEVRKKNIDFTKDQATDWADYRRYENANASLQQAPDVVLMGDSITDNWYTEDPDFFTRNNFAGRGISGQTVSQMLCRFRQDVVELGPKAVAIMAGTNDLCQQMAGMAYYHDDNIIGNIKSMCEIAKAAGIKVILCSVTPCAHYMPIPDLDAGARIVELNRQLKEYADSDRNITWLDYFTPLANEHNGLNPDQSYDGIHPVVTVYSTMEQIFVDTVSKVLRTDKDDYYVISMEKAQEIKKQKDVEWEERMKKFRSRR